jgi:pyruvyltransferase
MSEIELFSWNPFRPVLPTRLGPRIPWRRPVNNFGDLLGPAIVRMMLKRRGLGTHSKVPVRLLSVGSCLHFAQDADVVWGSGVNGKVPIESHTARILDVRAVRGPRTRSFLVERGINVPEVYGDPALLQPLLMPELLSVPKKYTVTVVPNFNDLKLNPAWRLSAKALNPCSGLAHCLQRIAASPDHSRG